MTTLHLTMEELRAVLLAAFTDKYPGSTAALADPETTVEIFDCGGVDAPATAVACFEE